MADKTPNTQAKVVEKPEARFHRAVAPLDADPAVEARTGFGGALGRRVSGRIFAMLVEGELVVKLPRERVLDLVTSGVARPYDAGKGRPMREWASVRAVDPDPWPALVAEAHAFVLQHGVGRGDASLTDRRARRLQIGGREERHSVSAYASSPSGPSCA